MADLAAALDPGTFVIGGGVSAAGDLLLGPAREAFRRQLTGRGYRPEAAIVAAELGNEAGLVGAADLARTDSRSAERARGSRPGRDLQHPRLPRRPPPRRSSRARRRPRRAVPAGGAAAVPRWMAGGPVRAACGMQWPGRHRGAVARRSSPRHACGSSGATTAACRSGGRTRECRRPRRRARWRCVHGRVGAPQPQSGRAGRPHRRILESLADEGPLVLAGDLNEDETGAAWRLIDVPDRLRLVSPDRPTFPARSPRRRLDVVFASPGLRVLPHREVGVPAAAFAAASDHLPTWVDLGVDG